MVFSSSIFLFCFMPCAFLIYYLAPSRYRNVVLFLLSLAFYFYGEGLLLGLLLFYVVFNYYISRLMRESVGFISSLAFSVGIVVDLGGLLYFKYGNMLVESAQQWGIAASSDSAGITLPIGISFYVFQSLSYLIDVKRGVTAPPDRMIIFGTYLAAFPQLIAGPIVRYIDVEDALNKKRRIVDADRMFDGLTRFSFGLGKKILIADSVGLLCDKAFELPSGELSLVAAWLGAVAYAMQIYFDFSGYSDMAIGMGTMLGFKYPENFNQPYLSRNFTEFWRRWHISLSTWFRDYLYISLGGNRCGIARTLLNLLLVFALCGLWHGAAWHFMAWGLFHGLFLLIERIVRLRFGWQPAGLSGWLYTFLAVTVGWVLFRASSFDAAVQYWGVMFGVGDMNWGFDLRSIATVRSLAAMCLAVVLSFTPLKWIRRFQPQGAWFVWQQGSVGLACLVLSAAIIIKYGFNVFIYFKF